MWLQTLRHRAWLLYLSLYGMALVPYMFTPAGPATAVYFMVLAWSGVALLVGRLLLARPRESGPLWLLSGNATAIAVGVLLLVLLGRPTPGPHDVFYMISNACGIAGTAGLIRKRVQGRDRESLLDALIISVGFALLSWVYLIKPAQAAAGSLTAAIVMVSYPVADLFILALLVRLLLSGGLRNPSMRLIAAAQLTTLVTDCAFAFVPPELANSDLGFHIMTAVSVSVFGWFGAAGLHPGFTRLTTESSAARPDVPRLRTPLLCAAVATGPALLFAQAWQHQLRVPDAFAIALGCAVVFSLVVVRMQTLVGRVNSQSVVLGEQAEQLRVLATRDGLTGLVNRRTWDSLLDEGLEHAGRTNLATTLAIIDLDHFKRYNDSNGHQAGDRLLKEAAAAWAEQLRQVDVLARYGGEEFIVLLPGCDATAAEAVVRRLRAVTPGGATFSAGIARWDGRETADQLVARADAALYHAKNAGRDRSVVARPTDPAVASNADVGPLGAGIHSGPDVGAASRTL